MKGSGLHPGPINFTNNQLPIIATKVYPPIPAIRHELKIHFFVQIACHDFGPR